VTGHHDGRVIRRAIGMTAEREGGRIPALLAALGVGEVLAGRLSRPGVAPLDG
jgi:hypothetical protein